MSHIQVPEVRWAQRSSDTVHEKNIVYLTVVTPDIVSPKLDIQAKSVDVSGADKHGKTYKLHLDLYDEIEPAETKQRHNDLNLLFVLQKKTDRAEFWPRLCATKEKLHYVRTDFDKWVDEDEQDEQVDADAGGMGDMASMMGGAGGMGGLDFSKLAGMNGMGGAGGDMDFSSMMASMGQSGQDGADADNDSDDEDEEDRSTAAPPKLEEV
ncbi:p23 chaperone protein wos2 [Savitreella phatthalungensis]